MLILGQSHRLNRLSRISTSPLLSDDLERGGRRKATTAQATSPAKETPAKWSNFGFINPADDYLELFCCFSTF